MIALTDYDPADNWKDLTTPENPIKEARDCGDNISFEVYSRQHEGVKRGHPDYVMTGGALREFDRCPHRWINGYREDATTFTEWGSLVDCLAMSPDEFKKRFIVVPETYQNEKGEEREWNFNANVCKAWRRANAGKQEVKTGLLGDAQWAATLLQKDEHIGPILKASRKQVMITGFYDDKETGLRIPLKCLIDLVPPSDFLADLKTCTNAEKRAWARHVHQFGYHEQSARHLDLWNAAHNDTRQEFRHYIQESFEPFEIGKRILDPGFISIGRDSYVRALKRYALCLKDNEWPGYDSKTHNGDIVIDGHLVTSPEAWMVAV